MSNSLALTRTLAAYVMLGGAVSLAGWWLDRPRLTDWPGSGISIQANAALAAMLAGLALLALAWQRHQTAAGLGTAVAVIGGLTFAEHLSGVALGIDLLVAFDHSWGRTGTLAPGRMGPLGAVGWLVLGLALAGQRHPERRLGRAASALALVVLALTGVSIAGYLLGAGPLYTVPAFTVIAVQTASFLFATALGVIAARPDLEPARTLTDPSAAGLLARRAFPLLLAPLAAAGIVVWSLGSAVSLAMTLAVLVVLVTAAISMVLWRGVLAVRQHEASLRAAHAELGTAHASLAAAEARLDAFLRQLPVGAGMFDTEGRWLYTNPMLDRFVRRDIPASDREEGGRWQFAPIDGKPIERADRPGVRALRGEAVRGIEALHTTEQGDTLWTRITMAPFRDGQGEVTGVVAIVEDIDEHKRAAVALGDAERQLRQLADHVPALIAHSDRDGRIRFVNRAFVERFGLDGAAAVAAPLRRVLGEAIYATVGDGLEATLAGRPAHSDVEMPHRAGGSRFMHVRHAPEVDAHGVVVGVFTVLVDISDRRRAEEALREASLQKDRFLAMLAHELRNPLAPLVASLATLHRAGADPAFDGVRATMERQVAIMVRLIDDLMDLSRLAFNKLSLQRAVVTLSSVVHDAVDVSRAAIDQSRQRLEVELPEAPVYVSVDPARVAQSLANLLSNASKFSPVESTIRLVAAVTGDTLTLRVRDSGIGLAPDMVPRVFEMFAQADSSLERARGGLGLGLTLARELVEMHGGSLTAASDGLGRGSEFTITLPHAVGAAPSLAGGPETPRAAPIRRILIVDDNRDAATSLQLLLSLDGLDVDLAFSGADALERSAVTAYDAVLLDIGMPGMNGYDVCRTLRARAGGSRLAILAMTGWGQAADRARSGAAGFDEHLVKPVDHEVLLAALARAVGVRSSSAASPSRPAPAAGNESPATPG
jgi:PAS domain S-box-containing protein